MPDDAPVSHPKVRVLRDTALRFEGQVWTSPRRHGAVRPTQGRTLALMQAPGGFQSFSAVNPMRLLGRRMRMITIPDQCSVAEASLESDEAGRMRPTSFDDRVLDVMKELMSFTLLTRGVSGHLTDRCSERKEAAWLGARMSLKQA